MHSQEITRAGLTNIKGRSGQKLHCDLEGGFRSRRGELDDLGSHREPQQRGAEPTTSRRCGNVSVL